MIGFPRFMLERNALAVPGIPVPFSAGSLVAVRQDDMLAIASPVDGTLICQWARFDLWTMPDESVFPTADAAFAELDAVCRQKRPVGEVFGVATVAGADLVQGLPVAVSRATGQLLPARADTYALAFVAGVASADTSIGFGDRPAHGAVTLPDWSAVADVALLAPGLPYFLAATGGLTAAPPGAGGLCNVRVGLAVSPTTMVVAPTLPIQL